MRKIYFLYFALLSSTLIYGQKINEVFNAMPENMLPGFSAANKTMLLVDTASSVIPYPLGTIELTGYSDDFLSIKTSSVGTMQIKLLPLINNSKIICVIKTVCGNFCDSDIQFYDTNWQLLDKNPLMPALSAALFLDNSAENMFDFKEAVAKADMTPISMRLEPDNKNLTLSYQILDYLSKEDAQAIEPFIRQKRLLTWNKSRFEEMKCVLN